MNGSTRTQEDIGNMDLKAPELMYFATWSVTPTSALRLEHKMGVHSLW